MPQFDLKCGVAFLFLALVLISGSVSGQDWGKVTDEEWQVGPPTDYPEANAVVLMHNGRIEITKRNVRIYYHVRIKVLTEAGIEEAGDQHIYAYTDYEKIKNFKAQTITPDGKKIKVEKDAIFEKTTGDYLKQTFTFPSVTVGSILEYEWRIESESHYYLRPWYFQGGTYTMKSEVEVVIPHGFVYTVQYQNVPPQFREPAKEDFLDPDAPFPGAKISHFTWIRENLPPITDEPYMSAINDYYSGIRFRITLYESRYSRFNYEKSWPEVGAERQKTLWEYCNKEDEIKKLAEEVTADLQTSREKSRAIYNYVTNNFKSKVEYNNWYFIHDRLGDLLKEKFGSPEGINVLLCEMHKALGMPAFPVMISRRQHGRFYPDFVYMRQFDYVIAFVQLGNEYEFLDASSRLVPYGVLPPDCLVDGGLLIDGDNSQLVRIRDKSMYSGRTDRSRIHITPEGAAACTTYSNMRGYMASLYGERYEKNDPQDFIGDYFVNQMDEDLTLGEYNCELDTAHQFVMTMDYTSDELAEVLDNNLIVKMVSFGFRENPFESEKRFFPVDFQYPFTFRNVMEVVVDGETDQMIPPADTSFSCSGATFERRTSVIGGVVTVDSKLVVEKPKFRPNQYAELRDFFDKVALTSGDELAFVMGGGE